MLGSGGIRRRPMVVCRRPVGVASVASSTEFGTKTDCTVLLNGCLRNLHLCPLSLGSRRSETRLGERSSTSCMTILMASASTDICRAAAAAAAAAAVTAADGESDPSPPRDVSAAIALSAPVRCCNAAMSGLGDHVN